MSQQPFTAASLRGAVDLSRLAAPANAASGPSSAGASAPATGLVVEGTDETFASLMNGTVRVPAVLVLWASSQPESKQALDTVVEVARELEGRLQVISVDAASNPAVTQALAQALQVQALPFTCALVGGQPLPLYEGVYPVEQVRQVLDQVLQAATAQGVTGRVSGAEQPDEDDAAEPELPPLHQEAFDAIERGDLDAARAAYDKALTENPKDDMALSGRAQVGLLQRTAGVDLQAARQAAAADPSDVDAQLTAADVDLLGGHVEDAFLRLIDLVRATSGDERNRVREHLVELFSVVGAADERVRKARQSLMAALY